MERGPVFIGGLAHSGKTEMRLMLSSHPNIVLTRRTYMWTRFYENYGNLGDSDNFERCLTAMLQHKPMRVLQPDPDRIRQEFWGGAPTYGRLFALFQQHYAERVGKPRWGDQEGSIERYADPIFAAYPDARMIHMIRDPRDRYAVSSTRTRQQKGKVGWDAARWLKSVSLAKRNQDRYSDRYKVVRYEALISRTEATLRDVCVFLGEEFVPGMVTMENAIRFEDPQDTGSNSASELTTQAAAFENGSPGMISERDVLFTQTYTRQSLLSLGYSLAPTQLSFSDRLLFYLIDWPINRAGMMAWKSLKERQSV